MRGKLWTWSVQTINLVAPLLLVASEKQRNRRMGNDKTNKNHIIATNFSNIPILERKAAPVQTTPSEEWRNGSVYVKRSLTKKRQNIFTVAMPNTWFQWRAWLKMINSLSVTIDIQWHSPQNKLEDGKVKTNREKRRHATNDDDSCVSDSSRVKGFGARSLQRQPLFGGWEAN